MRASRFPAFVVLAALCFGAASARADTTESSGPAEDGGKSPWLAATLAGGTALVGYGTVVGLVTWTTPGTTAPIAAGSALLGLFGPAAGHIYAGRNPHHAVGFAFARLGFLGVGFLGLKDLMSHDDGQTGKANTTLDFTLIGVAVTGLVGSTVWEAIDSYSCARRPQGPQQRTLALSPLLLPSPTGAFASGGLVLSGSL